MIQSSKMYTNYRQQNRLNQFFLHTQTGPHLQLCTGESEELMSFHTASTEVVILCLSQLLVHQ